MAKWICGNCHSTLSVSRDLKGEKCVNCDFPWQVADDAPLQESLPPKLEVHAPIRVEPRQGPRRLAQFAAILILAGFCGGLLLLRPEYLLLGIAIGATFAMAFPISILIRSNRSNRKPK